MSNYKPKAGDRVRVVLEGEVKIADGDYFEIDDRTPGADAWSHTYIRHEAEFLKSVEKVEPPVVTFKPGDVVRSRGLTEPGYVLTQKGYVDLTSGRYYEDGRAWCELAFTSKYYERVNLG